MANCSRYREPLACGHFLKLLALISAQVQELPFASFQLPQTVLEYARGIREESCGILHYKDVSQFLLFRLEMTRRCDSARPIG